MEENGKNVDSACGDEGEAAEKSNDDGYDGVESPQQDRGTAEEFN